MAKCLLGFVFYFLCFTGSCFAYDIEPYLKQSAPKSKNLLDLVFCPLNYQDRKRFLKDVDELVQGLKKTRPFDEINAVGLWAVRISTDEEVVNFKPVRGFPPLKARRAFLNDISTRLNGKYKLIIIDAEGAVSCAELSSRDKLSLVILGRGKYGEKGSFVKGFLHELGHSLGLRDECLNCEELCLPGKPNCAGTKKEAQNWWGDLVGKEESVNYISGCCGNKSHIRPTTSSLMNDADKALDFGPVNERYLRKVLADTKAGSRKEAPDAQNGE